MMGTLRLARTASIRRMPVVTLQCLPSRRLNQHRSAMPHARERVVRTAHAWSGDPSVSWPRGIPHHDPTIRRQASPPGSFEMLWMQSCSRWWLWTP